MKVIKLSQSWRIAALTLAIVSIANVPVSVQGEAAWTVESVNIDPKNYYGLSVANGMIGILSSQTPFRTEQVLINGAYEPLAPDGVSSIMRGFDFLNHEFSVDRERIGKFEQVTNFRQRLDMRTATFETSFDIGDNAAISYKVRSLRHLPFTAMLEVTVTAKRPVMISVVSKLDVPQLKVNNAAESIPLINDVRSFGGQVRHSTIQIFAASGKGPSNKKTIGVAQVFLFDPSEPAPPVVKRGPSGLEFERQVSLGTSFRFALVGSTLTSTHAIDPLNESIRLTAFASALGMPALIARHEQEWRELWKSDIQMEGDEETQREIRLMLYHLYSSIREGSGYSIAPMGLSQTSYGGRIFWDAETWMLPVLLALKPELARTMLDYRFERLAAAKRGAAAHGYRGAKFPWQSAESGDEDTAGFHLDGPLQVHISADVAIAAWNYFLVTGDLKWLREKGFPMIKETADFWVSRVERNSPGRFEISNVVGSNEYARNVKNDAFTNAAAQANLAAATAAAKKLGMRPDPEWESVRRNIPIEKFPDGVTREHSAYNGETIKQADVTLLAYPLRAMTDTESIRRDLEYYDSRTDKVDGPAMTKSITSILYQRLGMTEKAFNLFKTGYKPHQRPPFTALAETPTSRNPYFVTAAGGSLQAVLYGFGGLRITDRGLVHSPGKLPSRWKSLTLTGIGPAKRTYRLRVRLKVTGPSARKRNVSNEK